LEGFEIASFIRTCVTDDVKTARAALARDITGYAIVDVYASFFRTAGFAGEVDAVNARWQAGDRAGAVGAISPRVLDGLGVVGDEAFCRARIEAFAKAGLTMPVVLPFNPAAAAADVYVNVQGDEPLVTPGHVARLVAPFRTHPDTQVSTLKIRATDAEKPLPSVNKVVVDAAGHALYFSKFPIPYDRDRIGTPVYKHIGLYAYRRAALEAFHRLPPSELEQTERLEQLRFLENGIPITVVETTEPTVGVDTEDDLHAVQALLAARTAGSYGVLLALLGIAGVGYGTLNPASTTAAMSWFPPRQRATVVGLKQVGLPFGGMLGAALMPALALRLGWRWAIAAGALAIVACAALCATVYRDPTGEAPLRRAAGQRGTVAEVLRSRDLWLVASATLVFAAMQTVWMAFLALYLQEFVGLALLAASRYLALAQ